MGVCRVLCCVRLAIAGICDFSKEQHGSLKIIVGSKNVGAVSNVLIGGGVGGNYLRALVGIIKVTPRNARCNNKDTPTCFDTIVSSSGSL